MRERIPEKRPGEEAEKKFGLLVERGVIEAARHGGLELVEASREEDVWGKIDVWLVDRRRRVCIGIQISTNPELMMGEKGVDVVRRGRVPWFIPEDLAQEILEDPKKAAGPKVAQSLLSAVEKSRKVLGNLLAEVPMSQIIYRK